MNGMVPMNMLSSLMPMLQQGQQQQSPDPTELVNQAIAEFTQHLEAEERAGRLRTEQYEVKKTEIGGQIEQAGERFATAPKAGTADYALTIASLALPLIGALLPQGRGRRGQRAKAGQQQALTGLGQGLGQFQQFRLGREEKGRERQYAGEMKGLEHLSGLADMIYTGQGQQAAAQLRGKGELMRGQVAAERVRQAGLPTAEKGAGRLAFDREKFAYEKEQDELERQRQITEDYAKGRVGPYPFGVPTAQRYPEGYTKAVVDLNKSIASKDWSPDEKAVALEEGMQQLKELYGIDKGGTSSPSALLEQLRREQGPLENIR